jgi:hypothetical protein
MRNIFFSLGSMRHLKLAPIVVQQEMAAIDVSRCRNATEAMASAIPSHVPSEPDGLHGALELLA